MEAESRHWQEKLQEWDWKGDYQYQDINPCVFFWKQLANNQAGPICPIPHTLVLNQKEAPLMWLYSGKDLRVRKTSNANYKDYIAKVTDFSTPGQLVVVLKRPTYNNHGQVSGNDVKLLNSRYLVKSTPQHLAQKDQVICLQKYVRPKGLKPFLYRTIWSRNAHSVCYTITSWKRFDNTMDPESKKLLVDTRNNCQVQKSNRGQALTQTSQFLQNIVEYFQTKKAIGVDQLVGDFISDQQGKWWLINIKAFRLSPNGISHNIVINTIQPLIAYEKEKYQKTKACRYCQKNYLQSELNYRMTIKMLIQIDRYLIHMDKNYKWLQRSDITEVDSHCLYQEHKICQRCYRLYLQIQALMELQSKLIAKHGITLNKTPKQIIYTMTNSRQLQTHSKNNKENHSLNQTYDFGNTFNQKQENWLPQQQVIEQMYRYRTIIYLKELDQIPQVMEGVVYHIQYNLFGVKNKIRIDTNHLHNGKIALQRLKITYFFTLSKEDLNQYALNQSLKFNLIAEKPKEKKIIGTLSLQLKDYFSWKYQKKDFYKMFDVQDVPFGWGLDGSIGIIATNNPVNTSRIAFSKQSQLYLPHQNYYLCQALPEDWLHRITISRPLQKLQLHQVQSRISDKRQTIQQSLKSENEQSQIFFKSMLQTQISSYEKNRR